LTKRRSSRENAGRKVTPMLRVAVEKSARAEWELGLDEIWLEGALQVLANALELEVDTHIAAFTEERDDRGHRLVMRNDHAEPPHDRHGRRTDRGHGPQRPGSQSRPPTTRTDTPTGVKITDTETAAGPLDALDWHAEWNYTINAQSDVA
jgi:hypothetical protein